MFSRVVTFTDAKNIDAGIDFVRDTVAAVLHQQKGFAGTTASVDRANHLFGVLSLWQSEADRESSESALLKVRDEGQKVIGGTLNVELFEEALVERVGGPPQVGSRLLVTRVTMDPTEIDENLAYFRREVLPTITSQPGVLVVRNMVNRKTGESIVGAAFTDEAALKAGVKAAEERQRANPDMPVTIVDRSQREIVFVDLP